MKTETKTDKTAEFMSCIDPTEFATLKRHLDHPDSPIEFILYVKDEAMLAPLAARLEQAMESGQEDALKQELNPLFIDGEVKISADTPLRVPFLGAEIPADSIPLTADCRVIYLPPFYITHTPGLFEGKLNVEHADHTGPDHPEITDEAKKMDYQELTNRHRHGRSH